MNLKELRSKCEPLKSNYIDNLLKNREIKNQPK
jgi:hypothetical protein